MHENIYTGCIKKNVQISKNYKTIYQGAIGEISAAICGVGVLLTTGIMICNLVK